MSYIESLFHNNVKEVIKKLIEEKKLVVDSDTNKIVLKDN